MLSSLRSMAGRSLGYRLLSSKVLTEATLNGALLRTEYAVRGELVLRAIALEEQLKAGASLPFEQLVYCNIGNPQQLKQEPISYFRQVLAATTCPELLEQGIFPPDVVAAVSVWKFRIGLGT